MNENNKKKQHMATEAITQLINLHQNPDNKHFAFINIDEEEKIANVKVKDDQLSLAIGKKGQNVRLAAKLTGWKIDIKAAE